MGSWVLIRFLDRGGMVWFALNRHASGQEVKFIGWMQGTKPSLPL